MAVTYASFIAKAPGKNISGVTQTTIENTLAAVEREVHTNLGDQRDEAVEWLTFYKLAPLTMGKVDATQRADALKEYERICQRVNGGPRVF